MIAEIMLLTDAGYAKGEVGDDDESQEFARDVRRLNRNWRPGQIPRVPAGYQNGIAWRQSPGRERRPAPPRAQRGRAPRSATRRTRRAGVSRDGPASPSPDVVQGDRP
jgi:hypothetical protein